MGNEPKDAPGSKIANRRKSKDGNRNSISVPKDGAAEPLEIAPVPPEVAMLEAKVEAQETEIIRLMQMLQVLAGNEGQNVREAKILELSKRNRDLNLTIEKERRSSLKWKHQLHLIQEELLRKKQQEQTMTAEKKAEKEAKEYQEWRDKYNQANAKLMEVMAAKSMLSAEVTKLQHALQREVGDQVPISKILDEGGDWKGRSQQICKLKDKISDLKAKLKRAEGQSENNPNQVFESALKKDYEQMGAKLLASREELKTAKQKLTTVLARRNVLENEMKIAKEKMALLVEKSDNDDKLINALRLEIEAQRQNQGPVLYGQKVGGPLSLELVQRQHRLAASFNDLKKHCYQQELQIQAQTELINYLRAIAASQHDDEILKTENYDVTNNDTSEMALATDFSQFDADKHLDVVN